MTWKSEGLNEGWIRQNVDPHAANLITKMNKLPFLETTWSCGGHYEVYEGSNRLHCDFYHRGLQFAIEKNNEEGMSFIEDMKNLLKKFPFVNLELFPEYMWHPSPSAHPKYNLDIKWLDCPGLTDVSQKEKASEILEKIFNKTYGRLNTELEKLMDKWLVICGVA